MIPLPGWGQGLGTPLKPVFSPAMVRAWGRQTLLVPGAGRAFAPRVGCIGFGYGGFLQGAGGLVEGRYISFPFPVTKYHKLGDLKQ